MVPRALFALALGQCLMATSAAAKGIDANMVVRSRVTGNIAMYPAKDELGNVYGGLGSIASLLPWMQDSGAAVAEIYPLVAGDALEFTSDCPRTVYLSVFACGDAGCAERMHGKLPSKLAADGWARSTEGVHFTADSTGDYLHGTHMYGKDVAAGETVATPVLERSAYYLGVWATACGAGGVGAGGGGGGGGGGNVGPSRPTCADHCPEVPEIGTMCLNNLEGYAGWGRNRFDAKVCAMETPQWGCHPEEHETDDGVKFKMEDVCCRCGAGRTVTVPLEDGGFFRGFELAGIAVVRARRGTVWGGGAKVPFEGERVTHDVLEIRGRNCAVRWLEHNTPDCQPRTRGKPRGSFARVYALVPRGSAMVWEQQQQGCGTGLPPMLRTESEAIQISLYTTPDSPPDVHVSLEWECEADP